MQDDDDHLLTKRPGLFVNDVDDKHYSDGCDPFVGKKTTTIRAPPPTTMTIYNSQTLLTRQYFTNDRVRFSLLKEGQAFLLHRPAFWHEQLALPQTLVVDAGRGVRL
jgi:hypothetical protein